MTANRSADRSLPQVDLGSAVTNGHTQILALFNLYLNSPPDSRQAIVETILYQLASHLELEERLFQEVRPHGRTLVADNELEHEKIKVMLHELQQFEGDDDQAMDEYFEDMMQSVRALFSTEERDLLPLANRSWHA
jgi:hemerythrin HHE cation binding domain-containing protein